MPKWTTFPHTGDYTFDAASAKKQWARLHTGDAEPLPKDAEVLKAWVLFHNGDFQKAAEATKTGCIISRALAAVPMRLEAHLDNA